MLCEARKCLFFFFFFSSRLLSPLSACVDLLGVEDPKVVLTTSRNPSSRLQQFVKELRLLIPNSQRINRGGYVVGDLVELCRSNNVTDLLIIHEHRGIHPRLLPLVPCRAASFYFFFLPCPSLLM